jgi:uncharacterized membrane protein YjjP (DUF1212 family)
MGLPPAIAPFPMIDMLLTAFILFLFYVIQIYIKMFYLPNNFFKEFSQFQFSLVSNIQSYHILSYN